MNGAVTDPGPRAPLQVKYISPSALETFLDCPRKWAWTKIDRLPKPPSKAAQLGDETHAHHEAYLKHGKPYDLTQYSGKLAQCTQHLLPAPGSIPYEVEKERTIELGGKVIQAPQFGGFSTIKVAGIVFGGRQDLRWGEIRPEGRVAIVHDHKTTGSLNWVKDTKEKLLNHPQAPIYALIGMQDYETELAELRWTYALKDDRPKPVKSWHMVTLDEAYESVSKFLEPASHMLEVVRLANTKGLRTLNLPFNPGACTKYGGCPFQSKCQLTTKERLEQMTNPAFGDFLKGLNQMNPNAGVANVAPAQPAQAPPFQAPSQPAFLQAPQAQAPSIPAFMQAAPPAQAPVHYGPAVNPPESQLPPPPQPAPEAPAAPAEKPKRTRRTKAQIEADNAAAAAAQTGGTPVTVAEPETSEVPAAESPRDAFVRYVAFLTGDYVRQNAGEPEACVDLATRAYIRIQGLATQFYGE